MASEYEIAIKIAGQLEGSFSNAIKGAQSGLTGLGVSGKVGTLALKGVGVAAKATAATLAAAGTAIAAVGAYSVSVGKEFEAQMSTVQSISGATGEEFEALTAKAKEMGSTTAFSATEAGEAMEYMAMAGWGTQDMLDGIEGIMNLAAATGEELATTSDIVTDALTAFGLSASDTNAFVDDLAQAARNSNTDVSMMGESFKQVATAAGSLGYSTKDVAVALGAMANSGIKGEKSGTMLAKAFSRMSGTNSNATKAMEELGLSMYNTDGSARPLADVLTDMRSAFANLSDAEKENYAYMLGGQSAMNGLLAIVNTSESDWDSLTESIENSTGAAAEMAAIKLDNLEGDITLLKSAAEGFGISIYEYMQTPFREVVQYANEQLGILQDALDSGGFEGLASAIGDVLADGITQIADKAPDFIDAAATIAESLIDGIDGNSTEIGASLARLGTALIQVLIKLGPKVMTTGAHLMVEFAKGMLDNLPELKDAAVEAISYLMTEAKNALKNYTDYLGDDEVEPFKKIIALLPGIVAGFAVLDGIGGTIKGFVTSFKTAGKAVPSAAKGITSAGKSMSSVAKNILGVGAGLALAAAGIWLLVNAAKEISSAGPGAAVALTLMAGGLVALMVVAAKVGPQLQSSQQGLIAFGAAILMAAAGMALMSYAAVQISQAGPLAFAALTLMIGGMAGIMAIAGAFGTQLATAAPGLLAFGAAILIAAAGMAVMAYTAIQLTTAGTGAIVMFAAMVVGLMAFMAVAALLGPMLVSGGAGMLLLGAGLLLAATAMALLANTAIQLSAAGAPAIVTLAALLVVIIAFGAAAGALAPLLLAGAAATAALGAALLVVSAAAILGSAALLIISAALPTLSEYGASGAIAIAELGAAMVVFAAGAVASGVGAAAAAVGFAALAIAAVAADVAFAPLAVEMVAVAASIAIIAESASTAASGLKEMKGFGLGMIASMASLATAFAPVTVAIVPFAAAVVAGTVAVAALAVAITATDVTLVAMAAALALVMVEMLAINTSIATFRTQAILLGTSTRLATAAFLQFGTAITPMTASLQRIVAPMTQAGSASTKLATGMTTSVSASRTMASALTTLALTATTGVVAFKTYAQGINQTMNQAQTTTRTQTTLMVAVIRQAGTQIVLVATTTASGIRSAFSIDLTSSGRNMMQGFLNGMNSMKSQVEQTAKSIAQTAATAVNAALQIHSPSQLMMESGQYTAEGLSLGMESRTSDVATAATAMTQPVQDQSQQMRDMSAPTGNRSGVIGETIDTLGGTTTNNTTTTTTSSPTFNFNPTYVIEGNADQETLETASKMSQSEFEQMANEWVRNNGRVGFA